VDQQSLQTVAVPPARRPRPPWGSWHSCRARRLVERLSATHTGSRPPR